jgi:hypothetical protein
VARGDGGDGVRDLRFAGHVAKFSIGLPACRANFGDGFGSFLDVEDFDGCTFGGETKGNGFANAGRRAGNNRNTMI